MPRRPASLAPTASLSYVGELEPVDSRRTKHDAPSGWRIIRDLLLIVFSFLIGYELCLPVVSEGGAITLPFIATRMHIPGAFGLSLAEAILLLHGLINHRIFAAVMRARRLPSIVLILVLFFVAAIISVVVSGLPEDIPHALRFLAVAYFILAVRQHASFRGIEHLVVAFSLGLLISMMVNLGLTFSSPAGRIGLLPELYGQNGPGGFSGLFVGVSYLLYRLVRSRAARGLIVISAAVGVGITVLSLSKLGMLMAGAGLTTWAASPAWSSGWRRRKLFTTVVIALSAIAGAMVATSEGVREQAQLIWDLKFENSGEGFFDESDRFRMAYYYGTLEILARHPLGVSYTGIGQGLLETSTFRKGLLKDEDSIRDVNPHNSFLYYIAAYGWLGWVATTLFFLWVLRATWQSCRLLRTGSLVCFALAASTYVVFSNTLPSFFDGFPILMLSSFFALGANREKPVARSDRAIERPEKSS